MLLYFLQSIMGIKDSTMLAHMTIHTNNITLMSTI